jgi:uncharacterized protein DUF1206
MLNMFARLGFAARGIAYIVIGVIAVMMAFGVARHEPDRAGAIEAIAASRSDTCCCESWSSGSPGMAVWRFGPGRGAAAEPGRRPPGQGTDLRHRLCHRVRQHLDVCRARHQAGCRRRLRAGLHRARAVPGRRSRHRRRCRDRACRARHRHGDPGLRRRVTRHLQMGWMSRGTQDAVVRLGQAGYVARGGHRRHRDRCP